VSEAEIRRHGAVFENMLGRIDGRIYYNLVTGIARSRAAGFAIKSRPTWRP